MQRPREVARLSQSICLQHLIAYPISLERPCPQALSPCRAGVARCASCASYLSGTTCPGAMLPVRTHAHAHTLLAMPSPRPAVSRPATRRELGRWEFDQESPCDRHGRSTFSDHCMPASSYQHPCPGREPAGQRGDHDCLGGPIAAMRADTSGISPSLPPPIFDSSLCKCNSVLDTGSREASRRNRATDAGCSVANMSPSLTGRVRFPRPGDRVQNDSPVVVDQ